MCDVGKCKRPGVLWYEAFGSQRNRVVHICEYHWEKHCDDTDKFDLKTHFYPPRKKKS